MRISDWSSDVCSSDLARPRSGRQDPDPVRRCLHDDLFLGGLQRLSAAEELLHLIGRQVSSGLQRPAAKAAGLFATNGWQGVQPAPTWVCQIPNRTAVSAESGCRRGWLV